MYTSCLDVCPRDFAAVGREREKQRREFRLRRYHAYSRILIITIPTKVHERLHQGLYVDCYHTQLVQRGIQTSWMTIGTATFRSRGHPGGDSGEGDSTGGPDPGRTGIEDWPTLVVEAGDSESLQELYDDMRWWFSVSDHQVKIVILAKFDHRQRQIILQKWEEEIVRPPGFTTRSWAAALLQQNDVLEPVKRQEITITRDTTTSPVSYNVARGALVLGFRLLFLRDPGPGESDFVISVNELQTYASKVWLFIQD